MNISIRSNLIFFILLILVSCKPEVYKDISFYSDAFQTERMYRIYLPDGYNENSEKRYPVIYYFHGYGGRYKWDGYDLDEDEKYPKNGRKEFPFVMEWNDYVKNHGVIIVTWDGYEPNLNEGKKFREGIKYGNCKPYDFIRAHDMGKDGFWGWDYRIYFRDLVKHVDDNFRTKADRDHRAITGLSMGGLTSYYIAGQNKDLVCSVSAFCPADNIPYYGPKGKQVVFPVLEMHRSLKGLPTKLTMTDGDWLKYNDWELKRIFDAADLTSFEFHMADYPDHWTADAEQQLDFHMREFNNPHPIPGSWDHLCPGYPSFNVWGYDIKTQRSKPALSLLENVSPGHMKVLSRTYIPDGPIVQDETVLVSTSSIYSAAESYELIAYNLSNSEIRSQNTKASAEGKLTFELGGGGHIVGINGSGPGTGAKIRMVHKHNRENYYFEIGKSYGLDFNLLNVGSENAESIEIKISSSHPYISFTDNTIQISNVNAANSVGLNDQFDFIFSQHGDSSFVGRLNFEVKVNGVVVDTQNTLFYTTSQAPYITEDDIIIMDGRTVSNIPIYRQGANEIQMHDISGGKGNGNGILEPEEEALVYIRLEKGIAPKDTNTFHRTYLINHLNEPYINANRLHYSERLSQASKTHTATVLSVTDDIPKGHEFDLWFKVESLYNDNDDPASRAAIYAHKYDYRRFKLRVGN